MKYNNYFNHKQFLVSEGTHPFYGGDMLRFTFPNGYGASVRRHKESWGGTRGLWEIAVMFQESIVYDTPITQSVGSGILVWQNEKQVENVLEQIRNFRILD